MNVRSKIVFAAALALAPLTAPASAAVTVYSSAADFRAARPSFAATTFAGGRSGPSSDLAAGRLRFSSGCSEAVGCLHTDSNMLFATSPDAFRKCENAVQSTQAIQFHTCLYDYTQPYGDIYDEATGEWTSVTSTYLPTIKVRSEENGFGLSLYAPFGQTLDYTVNGISGSIALSEGMHFLGFTTTGPLDARLSSNVSIVAAAYHATPIAAGIPEPATWAMLILGFGAIGSAMRYRNAVKLNVRIV